MVLFVPAHHCAGTPRFIGHVHGDHSRHAKFDWAVERFTAAQVIVQIGMVQVDILAACLLMFVQNFAVFVLGNPAGGCKKERAAIAADEVVDPDSIAHRPQHVDRHTARVFADHFEVVRKVAAIGPLPDAPHAHDAARVEQVARFHDPRDAMDEQIGGDSTGVRAVGSPLVIVMRIPVDCGGVAKPGTPVEVLRLGLLVVEVW